MSAEEGDRGFPRAGEVIAGSAIGRLAAGAWERLTELAARSRTAAAVRRPVRAFQTMPIGERRWCVAIAVIVALAGHIALAALEPAPARPSIALTALALLAVVSAAIAAAHHNSAP